MKYIHVIIIAVAMVVGLSIAAVSVNAATPTPNTYQGKSVIWWAKHAQQARKDANARRNTIHRLKRTIRYKVTIKECVKLATIAYPDLNEDRAWRIIGGESRGNPNAWNDESIWNGEHASGLWQFIPSTFNSTPFGKAGMSIWSPCASSLAAGWMHANGRGGEWTGYGR